MFHTVRFQKLWIFFLPLVLGWASALLSGNMREVYEGLLLPSFAPPAWLFGPVWTVLYLMLGWALQQVWQSGCPEQERIRALVFFGTSLALNLAWSPVFFRFQAYEAAFWLLCAMLVLSIVTTCYFAHCKKSTLISMIPYDLWLLYAAALNKAVAALNA